MIEILCMAGYPTMLRGKDYYQRGLVSRVKIRKSGTDFFVTAEVRGSRVYRTSLIVNEFQKSDILDISGSCTCPVAEDCKHVVAVGYFLAEHDAINEHKKNTKQNDQLLKEESFLNWLEEAKEEVTKHNLSLSAQLPASIIYVLGQNLEIVPYKANHLKKGGFGKAKQLGWDNITRSNAKYIRPCDRDISELIEQDQLSDSFGFIYTLQCFPSGKIGTLILEKILQTGRLYWQQIDQKNILQQGQPRACQIAWRRHQNGDVSPKFILDNHSKGFSIIPCDPPIYVDHTKLQCGLVDHQPLSAAIFQKLLSCPQVPPSMQTKIGHFLLWAQRQPMPPTLGGYQKAVLPEQDTAQIALPVDIEHQDIRTIDQACLILTSMRDADSKQVKYIGSFVLQYGPYKIPALLEEEVITTSEKNCQTNIIRQPEQESQYYEQLEQWQLRYFQHIDQQFVVTMPGEGAVEAAYWQRFLTEGLPALQQSGWEIIRDDSFDLDFQQVDQYQGELIETDSSWFEVGLSVAFDGQQLPLLPLLYQWLERGGNLDDKLPLLVEQNSNSWLAIPYNVIQPVAQTLIELYDRDEFVGDHVKISQFCSPRLLELESLMAEQDSDFSWHGGERFRELAEKLSQCQGIEDITPPPELQADLRHYQRMGFNWLCFLHNYGFGGILADDMGLGKTIQTLAFLGYLKLTVGVSKPSIVIAPTSLLGNWAKEAERFMPSLRVAAWHGAGRHQLQDCLDDYDLLISSYGTVLRDFNTLAKNDFQVVILDEAQAIKNDSSQIAKAVRLLPSEQKLCLTGTPMENHLGELWSLFDFVMPGFLKSKRWFKQTFRTPIEKHDDMARQQELRQRIQPFLLRRTKDLVAAELPDKTHIVRYCELSGKQLKLYEAIRLSMEQKIKELVQQKGVKRSHIEILDALLKLRQACCDPRLLNLTEAKNIKQSAKLDLLMDMLPELLSEGRRILLFSQFTSMLKLIEDRLLDSGISYLKLTGKTKNRDDKVSAFQNGQADLFLISLKAGGFGLNLTAADTVIHYDPWWNPAVETQATDRAHRIGQDKKVFVYKLVATDTVEEKILAMQAKKDELAASTYQKTDGKGSVDFSGERLLALLQS